MCCDNEHANHLTIGLLALIAEHEAEQIAARTKAALAVTKGTWQAARLGPARPLGRPRGSRQAGTAKALPLAVAENARSARDHYSDVIVPEDQARREAGKSLDDDCRPAQRARFHDTADEAMPRGQRRSRSRRSGG